MKEKELAKFVDWLVQSGESPEGASFDETVSWINELATSEEGQQILGRLIQTYKNKEMGIFKEGGKLGYLLCLKKGGSIQDCGCGKKIEKAQGGEKVGYINKDPRVTRKETKDVAKEGLGYTNKEFRLRYQNEKRKANGDRQKARWAIIDDVYPRAELELPVINDDIQIEDYNIEFSPEVRDLAPQELGVTIQGYNEHMGDRRFKDAFRRARKYGLKEFEWNGKRYNTNLEGPKTAETAKIVTSETPSIPVYIPENKKSLIENLKAAIINNAPYMK